MIYVRCLESDNKISLFCKKGSFSSNDTSILFFSISNNEFMLLFLEDR
jgi:hypothetical protein